MNLTEYVFGSDDNLEETGMYGWTAAAAADEAMKHAVDVPDITWKDVGNVALDFTPVVGDIKGGYETVAMIGDELEKDDPNWYLIGAMGGLGAAATIIGLVPGAGDAAQKAIMSGARSMAEKSGQLAGDVTGVARAVRDGDLEFIRGWNSPSSTEGVGADVNRTGPYYSEVEEGFAGPNLVPESTRSGYKLMRKPEEGRLTSLFVNQDQDVPTGQWMDAIMPDNIFTAPNGRKYAPASTGDSIPIPDEETRQMLIATGALPEGSTAKTVKAVAARPGHHLGDAPNANHIGPERNLTEAEYNKLKDLGYPVKMNKNGRRYIKIRGDDEVWVRADVPDDVDWQSEANRRGRVKKDGTVDVRTAEITDELPRGGSYDYRQNSNNKGNWVISGQMKVQEELEREALQRTNKEMGRTLDSPTLSELDEILEPTPVDQKTGEFSDITVANQNNEPTIISFTKKKEDKDLQDFRSGLMSSVSETASKRAELVQELQEANIYGDYQVGARVQGRNHKGDALPPYKITGLGLNKVNLESEAHKKTLKRVEDRLGIKFDYIEKDGEYFVPMLDIEQADGGKSQVYLDALKQRDTPIMGNPTPVEQQTDELLERTSKVDELRRQANTQRFGEASSEDDDFIEYLNSVNPNLKRIAEEDRPNLRMGDMYGMLPRNSEVLTEKGGVTFHRSPKGDYYATAFNPDVGEDDVIGYITHTGESTELHVVDEMQKQGIGGELQYLFRNENPDAPTGGLTEAGEGLLKKTYDRMRDEGY